MICFISYTHKQNNAFEEDFTMGAYVCECSICKIHLNTGQIMLTTDSIYEIVITSELKYKLYIFKHWSLGLEHRGWFSIHLKDGGV